MIFEFSREFEWQALDTGMVKEDPKACLVSVLIQATFSCVYA